MSFVNETKAGGSLSNDMFTWGRQTFAKSYAQGGFTSKVFSPGGKGISRARVGSKKYNTRLESIRAEAAAAGKTKAVTDIDEALQKSRIGAGKAGPLRKAGGVGGGLLGLAFVTMPAFTAGNSLREKTQAVAGGMGSYAGGELGFMGGMTTGAMIGGSIIPVLGAGIGAIGGAIIGGFAGSSIGQGAVDAAFGFTDSKVDKSRASRRFGWRENTAAFNTQAAYTMRAASLQMMNKGMLSARSGLGHEGVMMHR